MKEHSRGVLIFAFSEDDVTTLSREFLFSWFNWSSCVLRYLVYFVDIYLLHFYAPAGLHDVAGVRSNNNCVFSGWSTEPYYAVRLVLFGC